MNLTTKSYSFYCKDLNYDKYDFLYRKAEKLRDFKNEISLLVCDDFIKFSEMSSFDWIKHFTRKIDDCSGQEVQHSIKDVYTMYENKVKSFRQTIQMKLQTKIDIQYYKRKTKTKNVGEVRTAEIKLGNRKSRLATIMTYISKWYNPTFLDYVEQNKNNPDDKEGQRQIRQDVLHYIDKFGEARIIALAKIKQKNVLNRITKHPIKFTSLSYSSCNEMKKQLLTKNINDTSLFGAMVVFSAQAGYKGGLHIPVKYSELHHGDIEEYYILIFKVLKNK